MRNFSGIEKKWQKRWEEDHLYKFDPNSDKKKLYCLEMFSYPSGAKLHMGHWYNYGVTDTWARFKRMSGYNLFHPMGFDAFGLPAENYAIKTGIHPAISTDKNIETMEKQLKGIGGSWDWDYEVKTCKEDYYKWTQWMFLKLYEHGLAYKKEAPVNFCPSCNTVLANEQVISGACERCGTMVVRKNMSQWFFKITDYAEELLNGLDKLDWPDRTKNLQRNWIGRSEGAYVTFKVADSDEEFTVFTTRCDTLFGATYCVLAPEHELVDKISTNKEEVEKYKKMSASKSDLERTELNKEKTGVFTGAYAINPVNNKKIPIWISDYVLASYGTGAIMAVPAHDERDYEFAKKFNIDIIPVIEGGDISREAYTGDGLHINSEFLNGLNKEDAINKMINWLEENNLGSKHVNYRLREWIFARQRYWGEPIPVIHLENGKDVLDENLPLVLPELEDYSPSKTGASPLDKATDWVNVEVNGVKGKRETSTMPGSAGSSWYFLRYIDPHNDKELADKKLIEHWMPVDLYIGGPEHAVGHLLYSRMWNNYLYDKGIVNVKEPFKKLVHQGMILGENGIKMGKRYPKYAINPNDVVNEYGADTLRLYEMFMGPLEADKPWSKNGVEGARRFLDRVYRLYEEKVKDVTNKNLEKIYHQTVKKVTQDYESLNFNTAISQMMIFINAVYKEDVFPLEYAINFVKLLNPIAPFMTEEIWQMLGHDKTIAYEKWPTYDEEKTKEETFEMVVQVNGKVRGKIEVSMDTSKEEMETLAKNLDNVKKYIENKEIVKIITVPKKLVNIVIK